MSDNYIPFEIQAEIMKKLPVKSLIQFRSVSKSWKHLIDTSKFIGDYSGQHTQMQHLLISSLGCEQKYLLIADDDAFPHNKVTLTCPLLDNMLKHRWLLGCSYGLLCLFSKGLDGSMSRAVVWNPCIRKAFLVDVNLPNAENGIYSAVLGFGVCRETRDPKLLKIIGREFDVDVEVFTLSGGVWRSPNSNLPRKSICFRTSQVVINGFLYLFAVERDSRRACSLIISFDLTSEEFREVNLPHTLAYGFINGLCMSTLRDSLIVLQLAREDNEQVNVVWKMEDGVPESFTKLFTINTDTPNAKIMGFRKSGEPIIQIFEGAGILVVYEAYSRHVDNLRIDGIGFSSAVYPYVETLLLHDKPNLEMFCLGN